MLKARQVPNSWLSVSCKEPVIEGLWKGFSSWTRDSCKCVLLLESRRWMLMLRGTWGAKWVLVFRALRSSLCLPLLSLSLLLLLRVPFEAGSVGSELESVRPVLWPADRQSDPGPVSSPLPLGPGVCKMTKWNGVKRCTSAEEPGMGHREWKWRNKGLAVKCHGSCRNSVTT